MAPSDNKSPLRIVPLGGLGEIGMNCMIFEYDDEIFVVDCGVLFSDIQMLGVDFFIPDFTYLKERKHKVKGYVITHAHEDHIGALPFALKMCPAPIFASDFARRVIEAKLEEHGLKEVTEFHTYEPKDQIKMKNFTITPIPVNHSIVEAFALIIDTPQGAVVHTGDFKVDANPFYGKPLDPTPFVDAGKKGVRLLLSDSTNVERCGHSDSEVLVYKSFESLLAKQTGLIIITMFASNIGRVGQILEIAKASNKKIAFLGRSMEQNTRLALEAGYLEGLEDSVIALDDIGMYPRDQVLVLSTGSQGEYRSGLARVANNEQRNLKIGPGDTVIMSSRFIPGNERPIGRMINSLFKLGADVLYESSAMVHVSGHATAAELAEMMKYTKPEFFVPVHGEYRHLVKHKRLAIENGVDKDKAVIAVNGDVLELTAEGLTRVDHFDENRVMIEGATGEDITKVVIKDRRKVAETGIVFAVIVRNSVTGDVMAGPDIMSRGFVEENEFSRDLIDDAKEVMIDVVDQFQKQNRESSDDLQEEIRINLRRFFNNRTGKKPVVMPILVEV